MRHVEADRWTGSFAVDGCGRWEFTVAGLGRPRSRRGATSCGARSRPGQTDLAGELAEGAVLLKVLELDVEAGARVHRARPARRQRSSSRTLRGRRRPRAARASAPGTSSSRARGAASPASSACCRELAELGFDVVYLPPIHPIGDTNRKGRNNALGAGPGDPAARGRSARAEGGHTAIDPELGTIEDFDRLVAARTRARDRDRARLRDPVLARPPVAEGAPRVVPPPARRDAQVRREPAEALPGHLQRQLREPRTGEGLWAGAARRRPLLGRPRRDRSSGSTTRTRSRCRSGSG